MIKKSLILGIILMSLLLASVFTVNAAEDVKVIADAEDDVIRSDLTTGTEITVKRKSRCPTGSMLKN